MKPLYAYEEKSKFIFGSILSSTLFFVHYISWASCQVINSRDLLFPFDLNTASEETKNNLYELGVKLQSDYQLNSKTVERSYNKKGRKFTMLKQHFYIKKSKHIIDEIDTVLAKHYSFTEDELDFIINYDIKYRMGKELETEDEE